MWSYKEAKRQARIDSGDVDTGSEWDGWHIINVYKDSGAENARRVRQNREWFLSQQEVTATGH